MAVPKDLVTAEDAERSSRNPGGLTVILLADASTWFRCLCRSNVLGQETTSIITSPPKRKRPPQKEYGRVGGEGRQPLEQERPLPKGFGKRAPPSVDLLDEG